MKKRIPKNPERRCYKIAVLLSEYELDLLNAELKGESASGYFRDLFLREMRRNGRK
jgi:hypothetical protein